MHSVRKRKPFTAFLLAATAVAIGILVLLEVLSSGTPLSREVCAYTAHEISALRQFDTLAHRDIGCAEVFNDTAADWPSWERPWFLNDGNPNQAWARWATSHQSHRQLVITQALFPKAVAGTDWLGAGAKGAFAAHARALARNLVGAGLGHAIIRLAPEANGTWQPYSLPATAEGQLLWRRFWRNTVLAMRSVAGAHFLFDWCVNAAIRPIPLRGFYPGDDVVDIVGVDVYDFSPMTGRAGWLRSKDGPDGVGQVAAFAKAHDKPLSIPEWGLSARSGTDDPAFVDGIAEVVRTNRVAYQGYFFAHDSATQLLRAPRSLGAYRRHFGDGGDSVRH